jgi:hypothetical protein
VHIKFAENICRLINILWHNLLPLIHAFLPLPNSALKCYAQPGLDKLGYDEYMTITLKEMEQMLLDAKDRMVEQECPESKAACLVGINCHIDMCIFKMKNQGCI